MNPFMLLMLLPLPLQALVLHVTPLLSRPDIFFAITVAPDFRTSPEGRAILSAFRRQLWMHTLLAFTVAAVTIRLWPAVVLLAMFWELGAALAAFVSARRAVRPHAVTPGPREIELAPRGHLPGGPLQLVPYLILTAAVIYLAAQRGGLTLHALAPALIGLIVCAGVSGFSMFLLRTTRRGSSADRTMQTFALHIILAVQCVVATAISVTMLMPFVPEARRFAIVIPGLILLLVVGSFVAAVRTTRRLGSSGGDFTPDACWRAGGFVYYNPDDPAIFVEKRFGIGYTLNFGNRWAWLAMAVMVLPGLTVAIIVAFSAR